MRLPEDYEEHTGMTPTVVMSIVAVTLLVGVILVVVLLMNNDRKGGSGGQTPQGTSVASPIITDRTGENGTESVAEGKGSAGGLTPDDLDFWDMYPQETASPEPAGGDSQGQKPQEAVTNDPATDGKHTRIENADGEEEWVLISPYLPKHEYDFTKLVCQSDFMKYYEDGKQVSYVGVDISKYQDYVDFVKVKKAGIDFVMLRVGARGYGTGQLIADEYFSENLKRATDAGLEVGVYFFSQAITKEEAVEEANMVLQSLGEYHISYPVAYDMERIENDTARTDSLSRTEKTEIAKAFLDTVAAAGYKTMLYGDKEWLIRQIDMSKLTAYDVWLSQQTDIPDYPYRFTMWQYNLEGSVDGIAGYADMNISFIDYSEK